MTPLAKGPRGVAVLVLAALALAGHGLFLRAIPTEAPSAAAPGTLRHFDAARGLVDSWASDPPRRDEPPLSPLAAAAAHGTLGRALGIPLESLVLNLPLLGYLLWLGTIGLW